VNEQYVRQLKKARKKLIKEYTWSVENYFHALAEKTWTEILRLDDKIAAEESK
jgi:hypothetical protein